MKIIISGYTGFVGSFLTPEIISNINFKELILLSRKKTNIYNSQKKNISCIQTDLTKNFNFEIFNNAQIFINLAGEIIEDHKMKDLHIGFLNKALNYINRNEISLHWIQLSSIGAYGKPDIPSKKRFIDENYNLNPIGEYEKTKSRADQLIKDFQKSNSYFTYSILRPSQIIGKNMTNKSISNLISSISKGYYFTIGSNKNIRSYVNIDDLVRAMILVVDSYNDKSINKIYNISQNILLSRIVKELRKEKKIKFFIPGVMPEKIIRLFVFLIPNFVKFPLTNKIIDGLVSRSNYSSKSIKRDFNFEFKFSIKDLLEINE